MNKWRVEIEISFEDKKLQSVCSKDSECRPQWGERCRVLQRRIAALLAAETLADMSAVPGRCHALSGNRDGQYALHLWGAYRLVFEPDHSPVPSKPDGGVDLTQVTKVVIVEIVDYHGD